MIVVSYSRFYSDFPLCGFFSNSITKKDLKLAEQIKNPAEIAYDMT